MRFNIVVSVAAMALFLAYYVPIVIKLKDIPLTLVVLGGAVLVARDIWESLDD